MGRDGARRPVRPTRVVVLAAVILAQASLGATCVDGVTPDCGDPAVRCAPSVDGATEADTSFVLPEASADAAEAAVDADAEPDGDAEPDADAGDEI